jgi:hypothetical protein
MGFRDRRLDQIMVHHPEAAHARAHGSASSAARSDGTDGAEGVEVAEGATAHHPSQFQSAGVDGGGEGEGGAAETQPSLYPLKYLRVANSGLCGAIPDSLFQGRCAFSLVELSLSQMKLSGGIPGLALGSCINLQRLDLCDNELTGGLPHGLSKLSNLKVLNLSKNKLTGEFSDPVASDRTTMMILIIS